MIWYVLSLVICTYAGVRFGREQAMRSVTLEFVPMGTERIARIASKYLR